MKSKRLKSNFFDKAALTTTLPATPPIVIADVFTSVNIFFATSTLPDSQSIYNNAIKLYKDD